MPTPTDPHARRVAALSAVIALTALTVAALVIHRLDATREALHSAKASCSGLVRASLDDGDPESIAPATGAESSAGESDSASTSDSTSTSDSEVHGAGGT